MAMFLNDVRPLSNYTSGLAYGANAGTFATPDRAGVKRAN